MKVPFYRPSLGQPEIDEVVATLKSGWLTTGPRVRKLEEEFAAYLGHTHAVAVNSCTAALHLALEALGVGEGDAVLVPTMTFAATAEVIRYFHAHPILVDCREADFNLDLADAKRKADAVCARGERLVAIVPMHYGGQIGDAVGARRLADRYNLKIVEDAAHCLPGFYRRDHDTGPMAQGPECKARPPGGSSTEASSTPAPQRPASPLLHSPTDPPPHSPTAHRLTAHCLPSCPGSGPSDGWLPVGSGADVSCYSFYANKTITTGEGGMACTQDPAIADRMRIMSLHGLSRDAWKRFAEGGSWYYEIVAPGFKYNLTDIAAAIGIHQLRQADAFHRRRTELADRYTERLKDLEEIILPQQQPDRIHSWHLYVIRLRLDRLAINRAQFIEQLAKRGIGTSVHWMPLHLHPYYREKYGYKPEDLPVAAGLYPEVISLPIYPAMTDGDLDYVCHSLRELVSQSRPVVAAGFNLRDDGS